MDDETAARCYQLPMLSAILGAIKVPRFYFPNIRSRDNNFVNSKWRALECKSDTEHKDRNLHGMAIFMVVRDPVIVSNSEYTRRWFRQLLFARRVI